MDNAESKKQEHRSPLPVALMDRANLAGAIAGSAVPTHAAAILALMDLSEALLAFKRHGNPP